MIGVAGEEAQHARTRKLDALNALIKRQNIDRAKLAEKQEQRLAAQHEGIERARERKEAGLAEREASARDAMKRAVEAAHGSEAERERKRQLTLERIEQMRERRQERQKDKGQEFEP